MYGNSTIRQLRSLLALPAYQLLLASNQLVIRKLRCPQRLGKLLSFLYWYSIDDELSVHYQCIEFPVRDRILWEDKSSVITRLVFAQSTPNVSNFFCCDIHTCNSWAYTRQKKIKKIYSARMCTINLSTTASR